MPRYLGLDSSTQSLSAIVIDTNTSQVVASHDINFGERLPGYGSPKGFLPNADPTLRHADPLMWVEALDLLFAELPGKGIDLSTISAIGGAGQQHGSVYLASPIAGLGDGSVPLRDRLRPLLSRKTAPIWMDTSTSTECAEIARAMGGDEAVVQRSGSRAIERFTGPQIRKFWKEAPAEYERTTRIQLVSSFMASVLAGESVPIEFGDGSGMNLLDLGAGDWHPGLLDATAPGLREKLQAPVKSATVVGTIADYFVRRYGLSKGTKIVAFTGDNPSSLVGMGATRPGTAVLSLGTSDTVFAAMAAPRTDAKGFGHAFANPAGGFMALSCFINGSLAREEVAKTFGLDWPAFTDAILKETKPGNGGNLMLPFFSPEITPRLPRACATYLGDDSFTQKAQPAAAVRAVVEGQALNLKAHSRWIGETFQTIRVTGGASKNPGILRILADVFQATILPLKTANASALGGALRAAQAAGTASFADLEAQFSKPEEALAVAPDPKTKDCYTELQEKFDRALAELLAVELVKG